MERLPCGSAPACNRKDVLRIAYELYAQVRFTLTCASRHSPPRETNPGTSSMERNVRLPPSPSPVMLSTGYTKSGTAAIAVVFLGRRLLCGPRMYPPAHTFTTGLALCSQVVVRVSRVSRRGSTIVLRTFRAMPPPLRWCRMYARQSVPG
jgi:hypothetical protein